MLTGIVLWKKVTCTFSPVFTLLTSKLSSKGDKALLLSALFCSALVSAFIYFLKLLGFRSAFNTFLRHFVTIPTSFRLITNISLNIKLKTLDLLGFFPAHASTFSLSESTSSLKSSTLKPSALLSKYVPLLQFKVAMPLLSSRLGWEGRFFK